MRYVLAHVVSSKDDKRVKISMLCDHTSTAADYLVTISQFWNNIEFVDNTVENLQLMLKGSMFSEIFRVFSALH